MNFIKSKRLCAHVVFIYVLASDSFECLILLVKETIYWFIFFLEYLYKKTILKLN